MNKKGVTDTNLVVFVVFFAVSLPIIMGLIGSTFNENINDFDSSKAPIDGFDVYFSYRNVTPLNYFLAPNNIDLLIRQDFEEQLKDNYLYPNGQGYFVVNIKRSFGLFKKAQLELICSNDLQIGEYIVETCALPVLELESTYFDINEFLAIDFDEASIGTQFFYFGNQNELITGFLTKHLISSEIENNFLDFLYNTYRNMTKGISILPPVINTIIFLPIGLIIIYLIVKIIRGF